MNFNKVYFYIALCAIIIGGVWASKPSEQDRAKIQQAAQQRKAKKQPTPAQQPTAVSSAKTP